MSEVAAQPSPEPPTLRDIVAAHTDALTGARLEMTPPSGGLSRRGQARHRGG